MTRMFVLAAAFHCAATSPTQNCCIAALFALAISQVSIKFILYERHIDTNAFGAQIASGRHKT